VDVKGHPAGAARSEIQVGNVVVCIVGVGVVAWVGVSKGAIAKFALPIAAQWALWVAGVAAAFVFAFLFHNLIDTPIQNRIRAWLKGRSRRPVAVTQPVVSLEG